MVNPLLAGLSGTYLEPQHSEHKGSRLPGLWPACATHLKLYLKKGGGIKTLFQNVLDTRDPQ